MHADFRSEDNVTERVGGYLVSADDFLRPSAPQSPPSLTVRQASTLPFTIGIKKKRSLTRRIFFQYERCILSVATEFGKAPAISVMQSKVIMKEEAILSVPTVSGKPGKGLLASTERVSTIDILRALTMVLMIFVNDLWSLTNIPAWLGHVDAGVDGIGLADVVFPAFLFIVGLSIPYAMENRRNQGDTDGQLVKHVLWRTVALLIMGVFLVNGETINAAATGMPRYVWGPLCCLCFILIWNSYPKNASPWLVNGVRIIAGGTLIFLAIIYRGGPDDGIRYFSPQWWGILGLIGWAYLVSALVAIAAKGNIKIVAGAWIFFSLLSMVSHAGLIPDFFSFIPPPISGGTIVGLTLGGVHFHGLPLLSPS